MMLAWRSRSRWEINFSFSHPCSTSTGALATPTPPWPWTVTSPDLRGLPGERTHLTCRNSSRDATLFALGLIFSAYLSEPEPLAAPKRLVSCLSRDSSIGGLSAASHLSVHSPNPSNAESVRACSCHTADSCCVLTVSHRLDALLHCGAYKLVASCKRP